MMRTGVLIGLWMLTMGACGAADVPPLDPALKLEDLGEPVRAATVSDLYLSRHKPTGETHLTGFVQAFTGLGRGQDKPFQIYDLNLASGQARLVNGMEGRPGPNATLAHSSGKIYIGTSRPPALMEYDPVSGQTRVLGEMSDSYYHGAQMIVEGSDGAVYVGLMGYHCARYDPQAGKLEDLGVMGDGGHGSYGYVYTLQADDRYVYCGIGQQPWYLVVYDRQTKAQRSFFRTQANEPNPYGGVSKTLDGRLWYERGGKFYELKQGEPVETGARPGPRETRGQVWPLANAAEVFKVEVDSAQAAPTGWNEGAIVIRYRPAGTETWRTVTTAGAIVSPNAVKRLVALPDGKLLGFAAFYGPMFTFDPATGKAEYVGPSPGSVYDMLVMGGKLFIAGYPSLFGEHDLSKPWTLTAVADWYDAKQNPKRIALKESGKYNYTLAAGADGRVYVGQHHERSSEGGSLGWYDPATGESGGLREPFLRDDVRDVCAVNGGKLIVAATLCLDPQGEGKLFVYDTTTHELVRQFVPVSRQRGAGTLMPAGEDCVIGVIATQTEGATPAPQGIIYKANVATGQVQWQKTTPGRVFAGPLDGEFGSGDRRFALGPDGCGWLFVDKQLCRLTPGGELEQVLACDTAGRLVFVGDDLYIYNGGRQYFGGFAGLKRVRQVLAR